VNGFLADRANARAFMAVSLAISALLQDECHTECWDWTGGVRVDFYDQQGGKTSELSAREGEIDQMSRDMTARGNVVIQTTEGTRMTTEELRFLNRTQKMRTDREVRFERAGNVLTGVGFESDPGLDHGGPLRDIHVYDLAQMFRVIDHERRANGLAALRASRPAREHWNLVLDRNCKRGSRRFGGTRHDHTNRFDLVDRGVGGVPSARPGIEQHVAFDGAGKARGDCHAVIVVDAATALAPWRQRCVGWSPSVHRRSWFSAAGVSEVPSQ
jgi:hypothetical protein